ncbi:SdrD B-like domain-containing protein [Microcoleus sp. F10-C6]|uniref:SdrD B-like domain-containing protein n=1 Tax=unclassified Microcoleus TaxID=2642155 RepID=UPI002FD4703D
MANLTSEERIAQQISAVQPVAPVRPVQVGNAGPAIIGLKFNDRDADGIRDPGEEGLRDVSILLEPATSSNRTFNANAGEAVAITDANGAFSFTGVAPGNYILTETVPAGFRATTPNPLAVTVSTTNATVFFGNTALVGSRIVGCKYLDTDNDGFRDGNEPGIKNVRIYLDINGNGQFDPATDRATLTDKNGRWSFDVEPGTYKVREERLRPPAPNSILRIQDTSVPPTAEPLEEDFPQSTPPESIPLLDVTVRAGETFACAQVGNTPLYQIEVNKFQDIDRNGTRNVINGDLEPAVPLVPFILDLDEDGRWDEGDEPIALTDGDGKVTFRDLFAGNYSVLEIFPDTLSRSLLPAGTTLPDRLVVPGRTDVFRPGNINLPVATTANPTVVSAPGPSARFQGTISREQPLLVADSNYTLKPNDPKFVDTNRDGVRQTTERLIAATGERPIFANTPVPFPAPNPSPAIVFSPVNPNNLVGDNLGVGNTRPNITIFKYRDLNANGRFEPEQGEAGVNGVQVFIDLNNDGQFQSGTEPTVTTRDLQTNERPDLVGGASRAGRALFQNLAPGTYTVREIVPPTLSPSTPAAVTVTLNTQDANVTFANTPNSNITGCKFEDFNQNGYRDGNEPFINGVVVYLDLNRDGVRQASEPFQTTSGFGTFAFNNLTPGTYSLREELSAAQQNFVQTTQPLDIVLGPNQTFTCALIGNTRRYDLLVPKFQDDDRDGFQDAGEPPLVGIPFVLDLNRNGRYDPGVDSPIVRTDANGIALFPDLLPDTYSVLEVFDASVPNPFPIPTGPNPVNFDVPGPNTVPSPPRPARSIQSLDPLTEGGRVSASAVASDDYSEVVLDHAGVAYVDNFATALKESADALIGAFVEAQKRDDESLFIGPSSTSLFQS